MSLRTLTLVSLFLFATFQNQAFAQHSMGLIFEDDDVYRSIPMAAPSFSGIPPSRFDLSQYAPPVGDQGGQSSCVGWAVAYGLKTMQEQAERNWGTEQSSHQFSPAFIYNQIDHGATCDGGSRITDALNLVRQRGAATLEQFPYFESSCSAMPTAAVSQSAREFAIADWRRVNVQDTQEMKQHIVDGFPLLLGVHVDRKFGELRAGQTYSLPRGPSLGGHAVLLVGYDDERNAFKILNSWGTGWGDSGYGWIEYPAMRAIALQGYSVQDIVKVHPKPPPAPPQDNDEKSESESLRHKLISRMAAGSTGMMSHQEIDKLLTPPPKEGSGIVVTVNGSMSGLARRVVQRLIDDGLVKEMGTMYPSNDSGVVYDHEKTTFYGLTDKGWDYAIDNKLY